MIQPPALTCRTFAFVTLSVALAVSPSCSFLINTSKRQCESQADCVELGFEDQVCVDRVCQPSDATLAWACLGNVQRPVSDDGDVSLSIMVVDVLTTQPPEGLHAQLCPKLDVDCTRPLSGRTSMDEHGRLVAQVRAGFDGYIELIAPGITPALFFVTQPIWHDTAFEHVLPVVSPEGFRGIAQAIGTTLELDTLGHTYALAGDCGGAPAAGVHLEIDQMTEKTASYYMINNVPVASAAATDASGSGGFLNLESGFTRMTARGASSGGRIGESGFIVRAGAVSYPLVLPSP